MFEWFFQLNPDTQNTLVSFAGVIVSLITVFTGTVVAIIQLKKAHESSFLLQKESIKDEYKRSLHAEIDDAISLLRQTASQFQSSFYDIVYSFITYSSMVESGVQYPRINTLSYQEIHERQLSFNKAVFKIMGIIEKYEIIEPRLKLFNLVFGLSRYDIGEVFSKLMTQYLGRVLPNNANQVHPIPFIMPNNEAEQSILHEIDVIHEMISVIMHYISDLRIEVQNILLGGLFGHKLAHRIPEDTKVISLVSPEYEILLAHFQQIDKKKVSDILSS